MIDGGVLLWYSSFVSYGIEQRLPNKLLHTYMRLSAFFTCAEVFVQLRYDCRYVEAQRTQSDTAARWLWNGYRLSGAA